MAPMQDLTPYNLIAKYLADECSEHERVEARAWIDANPEEYRELESIWLIAGADPETISSGRKRGWEIISAQNSGKDTSGSSDWQRISGRNGGKRISSRNDGKKERVRKTPDWFKYAAAVAVLAAGAFLMGRISAPSRDKMLAENLTVRTQGSQKAEIVLPDSTHVWLNSGTTIKYPSDYNVRNRSVCLVEGEAFFDVSHHDSHEFIVTNSDGIAVRVYGTEFNVNSYSDTPEVCITLESGKVDVIDRDGVTLSKLNPGEKLIWDKERKDYSVVSCDAENESVWRFGELRVDGLPLNKVIALMEKWYGVDIKISGASDSDRLYWMTIKTESLREMLALLNRITPIDWQIQGKEVILTIRN